MAIAINSINFLSDFKVKGITYKGIKSGNGLISNRSESGRDYNVLRYIDRKFTLELQYLTIEERKEIEGELVEAIKKDANILILTGKIAGKGYIDFAELDDEFVKFHVEYPNLGNNKHKGVDRYKLSINLIEHERHDND